MTKPQYVIVTGTSAGGISALSEFVAHLDPGMDAAVFIVMHLSRTSISDFLMLRLQPFTTLPCTIASNEAVIEKGHIYIAAANLHLIVKEDRMLLRQGPEENRWRPSVDVLFRSAGAAWNTHCIAVVLTGLLDDGTAGMLAVKKSGGSCIVQHPDEAEFPDMPLSVLDNMEVDFCITLSAMGKIISDICHSVRTSIAAPREVRLEAEIAERVIVDYEHVKQLGDKSIYACPDCGGGLWHINEDSHGRKRVDRYRCHIGHSYSEKDLVIKQAEIAENTLWVALRIMEERKTLLMKMQADHIKKGLSVIAGKYGAKAEAISIHVDKLKEILFAAQEIDK